MEEINNSEVASTETKTEEQPAEETDLPNEAVKADSEDEQPTEPKDILKVIETLDVDNETKEELKKGYMRQSDYTRKTQQVASLQKEIEAARATIAQPQTQFTDDGIAALDQFIRERQTPIAEDLALIKFQANHSDFREFEPQMVKIIHQNPNLANFQMLDVVYELAKSQKLQKEFSKAKDEGAREAVKQIEKVRTAVNTESPNQAKKDNKISEEDLAKMSAQEIKEMLAG